MSATSSITDDNCAAGREVNVLVLPGAVYDDSNHTLERYSRIAGVYLDNDDLRLACAAFTDDFVRGWSQGGLDFGGGDLRQAVDDAITVIRTRIVADHGGDDVFLVAGAHPSQREAGSQAVLAVCGTRTAAADVVRDAVAQQLRYLSRRRDWNSSEAARAAAADNVRVLPVSLADGTVDDWLSG